MAPTRAPSPPKRPGSPTTPALPSVAKAARKDPRLSATAAPFEPARAGTSSEAGPSTAGVEGRHVKNLPLPRSNRKEAASGTAESGAEDGTPAATAEDSPEASAGAGAGADGADTMPRILAVPSSSAAGKLTNGEQPKLVVVLSKVSPRCVTRRALRRAVASTARVDVYPFCPRCSASNMLDAVLVHLSLRLAPSRCSSRPDNRPRPASSRTASRPAAAAAASTRARRQSTRCSTAMTTRASSPAPGETLPMRGRTLRTRSGPLTPRFLCNTPADALSPTVPAHPARLAAEQGGLPPGVHFDGQECAHRGAPERAHPADIQALLRAHGCVSRRPRRPCIASSSALSPAPPAARPTVQLLQKLSIRGTNGPDKLLKVIRNDIQTHLGTECVRLALSQQGNEHRLCDYIPTLPANKNIVVFIGAMAKGCVVWRTAVEAIEGAS